MERPPPVLKRRPRIPLQTKHLSRSPVGPANASITGTTGTERECGEKAPEEMCLRLETKVKSGPRQEMVHERDMGSGQIEPVK